MIRLSILYVYLVDVIVVLFHWLLFHRDRTSQVFACWAFSQQVWEFVFIWHQIEIFFMGCEMGKKMLLKSEGPPSFSVQWEHSLSFFASQVCLCLQVCMARLCSLSLYMVRTFLSLGLISLLKVFCQFCPFILCLGIHNILIYFVVVLLLSSVLDIFLFSFEWFELFCLGFWFGVWLDMFLL